MKNLLKKYIKQILQEEIVWDNQAEGNPNDSGFRSERIVKNPNRVEFMESFRAFGEMDGIIDPETNDLYVWKGYILHSQAWRELRGKGINIEKPITFYVKKNPLRVQLSPTNFFGAEAWDAYDKLTIELAQKIRSNRRLTVFLGDNFPIYGEAGWPIEWPEENKNIQEKWITTASNIGGDYTASNIEGDYIFINPYQAEFNQIKKEIATSNALIDKDTGDLYVWSGKKSGHIDVINTLKSIGISLDKPVGVYIQKSPPTIELSPTSYYFYGTKDPLAFAEAKEFMKELVMKNKHLQRLIGNFEFVW